MKRSIRKKKKNSLVFLLFFFFCCCYYHDFCCCLSVVVVCCGEGITIRLIFKWPLVEMRGVRRTLFGSVPARLSIHLLLDLLSGSDN